MKKLRAMRPLDWLKAIIAGVINALLLVSIMITLTKTGVSPMPKPLGLAFADTLFGHHLPLPAGLAFHIAYVTFWSTAFVILFRSHLIFRNAAGLAVCLWLVALLLFAPIVGWGIFGLQVGPQIILGLFATHALFCIFLWGLCQIFFGPRAQQPTDDFA